MEDSLGRVLSQTDLATETSQQATGERLCVRLVATIRHDRHNKYPGYAMDNAPVGSFDDKVV
jgi:hypothetical protein